MRRFHPLVLVALAAAALLLALIAIERVTTPPARPVHPALWVVRDADTTIYLFGTVHMLRPGLSWFDGPVRAAFDRSDTLVTELVMPDASTFDGIVRSLGASPVPLSRSLTAPEASALAHALATIDLPANTLDDNREWLAATRLSVLPLQQAGYSDYDGVEQALDDAARHAGKPHLGLETAAQQLGYLAALPEPAAHRLLVNAIRDVPRAPVEMEATVGAWGRGDIAALGHDAVQGLDGAPELERVLMHDRNARWADWIAARMRRPGTLFIAVGAGHLAGADRLQAALAARGLHVQRIAS